MKLQMGCIYHILSCILVNDLDIIYLNIIGLVFVGVFPWNPEMVFLVQVFWSRHKILQASPEMTESSNICCQPHSFSSLVDHHIL